MVLSLQPLAEDARAWASPRARAGDFALLARERYADKAMSDRLQALRGALEELARRKAASEPPLDRADLSKVALAGFDLGAYTAMTVAGESLRDVVVPQLPLTIRAVIAISPYAGFSGPSFLSRYRAVRLPVLSITSDADTDALGVVTDPKLRQAPFEYMPAGNKYLAVLAGIPHRTFSGASPAADEDPDNWPAVGQRIARPRHGVDVAHAGAPPPPPQWFARLWWRSGRLCGCIRDGDGCHQVPAGLNGIGQ